jgi:hypothetical protein
MKRKYTRLRSLHKLYPTYTYGPYIKRPPINFQILFPVILSNFRKTPIVSYRIESHRIFFKNAEKETPNQTIELISYKNKKLKFSNKNKLFQTNTTKFDSFYFYS